MKVKVDYCSDYQLKQMFSRFYPESNHQDSELFVTEARNKNPNKNFSPAQVQGYFMFHKNNPQTAIENVHTILKS